MHFKKIFNDKRRRVAFKSAELKYKVIKSVNRFSISDGKLVGLVRKYLGRYDEKLVKLVKEQLGGGDKDFLKRIKKKLRRYDKNLIKLIKEHFNNSEENLVELLKKQLGSYDKNSFSSKTGNSCVFTGRSNGVHRLFRVSRIELRRSAAENTIYGLRKSSW
jgi:ribosomal protein S14